MSAFDFPTWAYTKLAGKPEEPPKVQPMPTPTLDELDAFPMTPKGHADAIDARVFAEVMASTPKSPPKKRGRPRKEPA